jgi:hypothetical protein
MIEMDILGAAWRWQLWAACAADRVSGSTKWRPSRNHILYSIAFTEAIPPQSTWAVNGGPPSVNESSIYEVRSPSRELTSSFVESVKNSHCSPLEACMCMHCHVRTLSWLYPAEFNQPSRVRSVQHNWVLSSTTYVQCSTIGFIHQSSTFSAVQFSTVFTVELSTFHGFYSTNNIDRLTPTTQWQIPPLTKNIHREVTLPDAARL